MGNDYSCVFLPVLLLIQGMNLVLTSSCPTFQLTYNKHMYPTEEPQTSVL